MDSQLVKIRLTSFLYGFFGLLVTALVGVLLSPDFSALIKANFGESVITSVALLLAQEVAKHLRNLAVLKKLAGREVDGEPFLI